MVTIPTIPNHDTIGIYSGGVSTPQLAAPPGYQYMSVNGSPVTYAVGRRIQLPTVTPGLSLSSPSTYRVFQRNGSNQANIVIAGTYTGQNQTVEARWGDGTWETVASPTDGVFSGSILRGTGQGTLSVRMGGTQVDVPYVGIGDIFGIWGQSNGSGRGTNNQSYSHASLKAAMLGNDNTWKELTDPTDIATNQVDSISYDGPFDAAGSVWPLVATAYMASKGFPVAFVPCCRGGNGNVRWQPPVDHFDRNTLYGSALYRTSTLAGGCKAVLYWAGEPGVDAAASDYGQYKPIAVAVAADLGVPVMRCKLQYCTGGTLAEANGVAAAVQYIWDNPVEFNAVTGPDFSDIISDDGFHLITDPKIQLAASRWATAMLNAF